MTRKSVAFWTTLLGTFLITSGCADTRARSDLNRLEKNIRDLRTFQAEQTAKLSAIDTELRTLAGRLDEIEYQQNQKLGSALSNIESNLSHLRKRVPPPPIVPLKELEQDEAALSELPPELSAILNDAYGTLREGNFEKTLRLIDEGLGLAIGTDYLPHLLFWRGIAFEGANRNREAVENYLELASKFPRYRRTPLALLRQGSVMVRLGDKRAARVVFNKLIADFPKSAEAQRARERLKDL